MEFPQDFTVRERALLGARFDELYAYATPQPARGVTVNALRCTPEWFAQHADFDAKPSPFCPTAFTTAADFRPGRHAWHHAGVLYAQEPSASAPAALLDVQPGMRVADLCAAPGGKTSQLAAALQAFRDERWVAIISDTTDNRSQMWRIQKSLKRPPQRLPQIDGCATELETVDTLVTKAIVLHAEVTLHRRATVRTTPFQPLRSATGSEVKHALYR